MKYIVLIIDGAAGLPLEERQGKTCLELAATPNLDKMASEGYLGLTRTVPEGLEPGSAPACMSVIGYDPVIYYKGRAAIEARAMSIPVGNNEVVFRCNIVSVRDGIMHDYSAGHISTKEAAEIIATLNGELGGDDVMFYPGINYRHILKLRGYEDTLQAICTPPHDILDKPIEKYLPHGEGSRFLRELMEKSEFVLKNHPVNAGRRSRGKTEATGIWLFWGCGRVPDMPAFKQVYGISAAMTSGVDLLRGLANMASIDILEIPGVTDGPDNDFTAQVEGAIGALERYDLVVVHVEAPDEAGHSGIIDDKVKAIQQVDNLMVNRILKYKKDVLRVLVMPDHPTPIALRTHTGEPVPFMLWGRGITPNGAGRFTEAEAGSTGAFIGEGYKIMGNLVSNP